MHVHGSRQPYTTPLLTQFMLLLVLADILRLPSSVRAEGKICGCWGENQIYVHYKPPVSGWFVLSRRQKFLYERVYTVFSTEPQIHHFLLRYMVRRKYWVLLRKKAGRWDRILSNSKYSNTERIIVSCPSGRCSCQSVHVGGSSCPSINGYYNKMTQNLNSTHTKPAEKKRKRSQCLLTQLSRCLIDEEQSSGPENDCQQYTHPLMGNNTESKADSEEYVNHKYNMIKDDNHDFWLIESENMVYAVSRNTGPCPDQLTPDPTAWIRTDDRFSENITVTCNSWDSPSGD